MYHFDKKLSSTLAGQVPLWPPFQLQGSLGEVNGPFNDVLYFSVNVSTKYDYTNPLKVSDDYKEYFRSNSIPSLSLFNPTCDPSSKVYWTCQYTGSYFSYMSVEGSFIEPVTLIVYESDGFMDPSRRTEIAKYSLSQSKQELKLNIKSSSKGNTITFDVGDTSRNNNNIYLKIFWQISRNT